MTNELQRAIRVLEQVQGGMVDGRVVPAAELEPIREGALRRAHTVIASAIEQGPPNANATFTAIPPWARPLLDSKLMAKLEAIAATYAKPVPERVVHFIFGGFSWSEDIASYVSARPLVVGALSVSISLGDVDRDGIGERLRAHGWLPSRLVEVIEAARRFAAAEALDEHFAGYADPDEGSITAAEFCARLTPEHVSVEAETSRIHFDDGDLFWGHELAVVCDLEGRPIDLSMAG